MVGAHLFTSTWCSIEKKKAQTQMCLRIHWLKEKAEIFVACLHVTSRNGF